MHESEAELLEHAHRGGIGDVGAGADRRHGERPEAPGEHGARDLRRVAAAAQIVGDAVDELDLRRVAERPETGEPNQPTFVVPTSAPQPDAALAERPRVLLERLARALPRDDFVV